MNRRKFEHNIIEYLEGTLDAREQAHFEQALAEDAELRKIYEEYRAVCSVEKALAAEQFQLGAGFEVKVMERIEEVRPGVVGRFCMAFPAQFRYFAGSIATVATLVLVLKMSSQTSEHDINRVSRPSSSGAAEGATPAVTALPAATLVPPLAQAQSVIKPGQRALAVEVPSSSEGWSQPGARVDMILTYVDPADGVTKSSVIAENATVVSHGGQVRVDSPSSTAPDTRTAVVALSPDDAAKVEAARQNGKLSMFLRAADDVKAAGPATVTAQDLVSAQSEPKEVRGVAKYIDGNGVSRELELRGNTTWAPSGLVGDADDIVKADPSGSSSSTGPKFGGGSPTSVTIADLVGRPADMARPPGNGSTTPPPVSKGYARFTGPDELEPFGLVETPSHQPPPPSPRRYEESSQTRTAVGARPSNDSLSPHTARSYKPNGQVQYDYLNDHRLRDGNVVSPGQKRSAADFAATGYGQDGAGTVPPFGSYSQHPDPAPWSRTEAEQYIQYEESPRTATTLEPMTTFGVDVDTASYTNARRFLSLGQLPPPASVRIEELLNYFNYDYPTERERPFGVTYEIAPSPLEPGRHLLRFAIKARDLKEAVKPWNLVFLVDVSGSMSDPNKLELVKSGLRALVGKMRPTDRVAIVTYAGDTRVALESTSVQDRTRIISAIDSLYPGGSTNGEGGIKKAYEIVEASRIAGGVNRVVLATDGDFNVGVTSHADLVKMIEEKRRSGITLTTLGVGTGNIHDGTLEQLANKGNGNYFYLDTVQEARRVLEENVFGTMEVVAKDVKLQVEFNPNVVAQYRLIGYDNRKLENHQFNDDTVDSGEIGSGHAVTALYEITLVDSPLAKGVEYRYRAEESRPAPKTESTFSDELGFLKIRFKAPDGNQSELLEFPLTKASVRARAEDSTDDFRFAAAVSYFGHLLRKSKFSGSYTFAEIAQLADKARGPDADGKRREFVELARNASVGR